MIAGLRCASSRPRRRRSGARRRAVVGAARAGRRGRAGARARHAAGADGLLRAAGPPAERVRGGGRGRARARVHAGDAGRRRARARRARGRDRAGRRRRAADESTTERFVAMAESAARGAGAARRGAGDRRAAARVLPRRVVAARGRDQARRDRPAGHARRGLDRGVRDGRGRRAQPRRCSCDVYEALGIAARPGDGRRARGLVPGVGWDAAAAAVRAELAERFDLVAGRAGCRRARRSPASCASATRSRRRGSSSAARPSGRAWASGGSRARWPGSRSSRKRSSTRGGDDPDLELAEAHPEADPRAAAERHVGAARDPLPVAGREALGPERVRLLPHVRQPVARPTRSS